MKTIDVPTGKIIVDRFKRGELEFLSIGDYGQDKNIKADFLGFSDEINGVPNGEIMPLERKWVITISTQYGCSMKCKFCDVPQVGPGRNVSFADMVSQIMTGRMAYPDVQRTERLNIHFARMGEPTFNADVLKVGEWLGTDAQDDMMLWCDTVHPVLTTMMPKRNKHLKSHVRKWIDIKNGLFEGEANIQVSINSTSDAQRDDMYQGCTLSIPEIAEVCADFPAPNGRKYCINMAMADGYEADGEKIARLFSPDKWMVKITPIHVTTASAEHGIETTGGYDVYEAYAYAEHAFKHAGFDTLVFVPSYDEDFGMITCGNAVLSGRMPSVPHTVTDTDKAA